MHTSSSQKLAPVTPHSGHLVDAGFISNLVAPNTGYLRQQPQFFDKVRAHANGRSWEELCDATVQLCFSWQKASKGKKSRDPKVPLQGLLSLKVPLQPVKRAIQGLDEASARQPDGVIAQAVFKRDATLLALAMSNPLRERTLTTAKYIAPGEPNSDESNLYQTEGGVWRLRFFKGDMKNDEYNVGHPSSRGRFTDTELVGYCSGAYTVCSYRPCTDALILADNKAGSARGDSATALVSPEPLGTSSG